MPFNPEEFIPIAELLVASDDESKHRSAANRAYYAAYLIAESMSGIDVQYKDSHQEIWNVFNLDYCTNGQSIRDRGTKLKKRRQHADYDMSKSFSRKEAEYSIKEARDLIVEIKKLPPVKTTYRR